MNKEKFINLELCGLIFTLILGLILKYSIVMFGMNLWTMLISSINGSIWECTKVFALSYLIWGCIEYCVINVPLRDFIVSKVLGMYTLLLVGIFTFWIVGIVPGITNFLVNTILIFFVVCIAYAVSYKFILSDMNLNDWFVLSLFSVALFFAMYFCFVIGPPHIDLFIDKHTYSYGIQL